MITPGDRLMWSVNKRTAVMGLLVMNSGAVKPWAQKREILYD
jgi:hypothetical protein